MKLYLYDFDGTIYDGDSSVDFFLFCLKKNKKLLLRLPKMLLYFIKYKTKNINDTKLKEYYFSYLKELNKIEELIKEFWQKKESKIKEFYLKKDHSNDIIISASPEFLLKPICDKLKVKDLIASSVDINTGHFNKPNNRKEVKVAEFRKLYPKAIIEEMYSDSQNDKPLLDLANKAYFVKKNKIYDYRTYKENIIKRAWNYCWSIYHKNEEVWNYLIVGGLTTLVSIGTYAIFRTMTGYIVSNILSWIVAVIFAYYTNRWFVFKSNNKNKIKEFITFSLSRVITLLIDTSLMILLIEKLNLNDMLSKILVQVIVIIGNYLISKLFVFKKE